MSTKRSGFTMTELLVVIVIVSTLVGLAVFCIGGVRGVREAAMRTTNHGRLHTMSIVVHAYHDVHKKFPPATGPIADAAWSDRSLSIHLLLYVEQLPLYQQYTATSNLPPVKVPAFHCPLDSSTPDWIGVQNLAGNVRVFSDVGTKTSFNSPVVGLTAENGTCTATFKDIPDGTSNTIMFATRYANGGTATGNGTVSCSAYAPLVGSNNSAFFGVAPMTGPVSRTSAGGWQVAPNLAQVNCQFGVTAHAFTDYGLQIALVDGSYRTITPGISPFTWNAAMQPNDGHDLAASSDW